MTESICALSTSCFGRIPVGEAIEHCLNLGARAVELSAPHPHQPVTDLIALCQGVRQRGIPLSLHNYFPAPEHSFVLNPASTGADQTASMDLILDALAIAVGADIPLYAVHAGYLAKARPGVADEFEFGEQSSYAEALPRAADFLAEIAPKFESAGVTLAFENLFPSRKLRHSLCCTFDEVVDLMDMVPNSVGLLLDFGHLNISANLLGFDREVFLDRCLDRYGPRIVEVHFSENAGEKDDHRPLSDGSWQLAALAALKTVPRRDGRPRIYTLESRRAEVADLSRSLSLIETALSK